MRYDLYQYITENENTILIHNEMFPYKHERILNFSISEFSTLGVAKGLALQGYKVIVFDTLGFLFFKNIYMLNEVSNWENVYLCVGGCGFTYHPIPHHTLYNDLVIANFLGCKLFSPITKQELYSILNTKYTDPCYIRLFPEVQPYIKLKPIKSKVPVVAYGWIYEYLKQYVLPIIRWDLSSDIPYESILIEDHIRWKNTKYWFGITKEQAIQSKESMNTFLAKAWYYVYEINKKFV